MMLVGELQDALDELDAYKDQARCAEIALRKVEGERDQLIMDIEELLTHLNESL